MTKAFMPTTDASTQLHMPLFVPFLNAPAGGVALYCDDFYLAEHDGKTHFLCGDAALFKKALGDDAATNRLTAANAYLFLEANDPIVLLQKGTQILKYDPQQHPSHIFAIIALKALVHRCKGLVDWQKLKYYAHPVTATFCAEGLKRTPTTLNSGLKALKLDL